MGIDSGTSGEAAWREWKAQCALDLCSERTAAHLCRFGQNRFRRYVERCLPQSGPVRVSGDLLSPRNAWHRFEIHLCVHETRAGKRYKDWLFQRANNMGAHWERIVEAGASVLMRDVVREYLRHEHAIPWMRSLQEPVAVANGAVLTAEDLLPGTLDPSGEVEQKEIQEAADRMAEEVLAGLVPRERVALAARASGMPLSHAGVLKAAGCGKTVLYTAYQNIFRKIAVRVREEAEIAGAAEQTVFALHVYEQIKKMVHSEISPEFRMRHFSMDMEDVSVRRGKAGYGSVTS